MADRGGSEDAVALAIGDAERALNELAGSKRSDSTSPGRIGRKVPFVKHWFVPLSIVAVLFAGQALIAALVDSTTVAAIFAVGAVIVAILSAVVAVLSYAQQASVPPADIIKVLDRLLKALEELRKKDRGANGKQLSSDARDDPGAADEAGLPTRPMDAPS